MTERKTKATDEREVEVLLDLVKRTVRAEMAATVTEARNQLSDAVKEAWDAKEHGTCGTCGWWSKARRVAENPDWSYDSGDCNHDPEIHERFESSPSCVHWSPSKAAHGVCAQWIGREPR